jgi:hypothetical protein
MAIQEHVYAGFQFPGRQDVRHVMLELDRQAKARRDRPIRSDRLSAAVVVCTVVESRTPAVSCTYGHTYA